MRKHSNIKKCLCISATVILIAGVLLVNTWSVRAGGNGADADQLGAGDASTQNNKIYAIASISKVYSTCAVMQLSDKGLVDLDEPVVTYIPDFKMADERYKNITVRMLMDHTSGIMGTTDVNGYLYDDNDTFVHDEFLNYLSRQRLKAEPGEYSTYCNDGFFLLEILVERVTGQDYTEYLTENIVEPLGLNKTGSYRNLFRSDNLASVYDENKQPLAFEYCTDIGSGGILATSYDVCRFGSAFFVGDNTLLSEKAKNEMARDESQNQYEGHYALGWDDVDMYEGTGVKVVGKGGDLHYHHGELMVAPEEKISIAVLSSGGNSTLDTLLAKSLMDIVLTDMGKDIGKTTVNEAVLLDEVPDEYRKYEGFYTSGLSMVQKDDMATNGTGIYHVTFPDMKYLKMELCDATNETVTYYKYSESGEFVRMVGDVPGGRGMEDTLCGRLDFDVRDNGKTYIVKDDDMEEPRLGEYSRATYFAEKIESNNCPDATIRAWQERDGLYYLASGKYSYSDYAARPYITLRVSDTLPGYLFGGNEVGGKVFRIEDENHALGFVNIPGQNGRDLKDCTVEVIDGREYIAMEGTGLRYLSEKDIPAFPDDLTEFTFDKRDIKWYNIDKDNLGGKLVGFDRTEETSVYVYDKYNNCIYNTYMTGFGDRIPLPTEGKIMFAGEPGEKIRIIK